MLNSLLQGKVSSRKTKSSDAIAGDLKNLVGRKIKCPNGIIMYFVPESHATLPISPNLDLSFHNPLVKCFCFTILFVKPIPLTAL